MKKIGCVTRFHKFYPKSGAANRIKQEFFKSGYDYVHLNPDYFKLDYTQFPVGVHFKGIDLKSFSGFDFVLEPTDTRGIEVVSCLEAHKYPFVKNSFYPKGDKFSLFKLFQAHNLNIPKTDIFSCALHETPQEIGWDYPFVVKARHGWGGSGVQLIESHEQWQVCKQTILGADNMCLLQEVITPVGQDRRLFVVGGVVVAAMKRFAKGGGFLSNYAQGGTIENYMPNQAEVCMALEADKVFGGKYSGVDIMGSPEAPVLIELNKSPGLKGIESVTGVNIAQSIVDLFSKDFTKN